MVQKRDERSPCCLIADSRKIHPDPEEGETAAYGGVCPLCEWALRLVSWSQRVDIWRETGVSFHRICGRCGRECDVYHVRPAPLPDGPDGYPGIIFLCWDC